MSSPKMRPPSVGSEPTRYWLRVNLVSSERLGPTMVRDGLAAEVAELRYVRAERRASGESAEEEHASWASRKWESVRRWCRGQRWSSTTAASAAWRSEWQSLARAASKEERAQQPGRGERPPESVQPSRRCPSSPCIPRARSDGPPAAANTRELRVTQIRFARRAPPKFVASANPGKGASRSGGRRQSSGSFARLASSCRARPSTV